MTTSMFWVPGPPATRESKFMFWVPGSPATQGSKKAIPGRNGRTFLVESSKMLKPWRVAVAMAAAEARPQKWQLSGPMRVTVEFRLGRPAGHRGVKGLRPSAPAHPSKRGLDVDKGARAILDALTGVLYDDDSQVVELMAYKRYVDVDPGAMIELRAL